MSREAAMAVHANTSTEAEEIPKTYEDATQMLAEWHSGIDRPDLEIYAFPDPEGAVVRLVEISGEFPETDEVVPVTFGKSEEFPFKSSVVILTPTEWQQVLAADRALPAGWDLTTRRKIWPHDRVPGVSPAGAK